eukprot:740955_1
MHACADIFAKSKISGRSLEFLNKEELALMGVAYGDIFEFLVLRDELRVPKEWMHDFGGKQSTMVPNPAKKHVDKQKREFEKTVDDVILNSRLCFYIYLRQ